MEYTNLVTAAMSLVGTLAGTFGGTMVSNRLSNYRIGQLEEKVAKHNNLDDPLDNTGTWDVYLTE